MRNPVRSLVLAALLLASIGAGPVTAQRDGRRGPADREQLEQRVRAQMGRLTRERLGLTDEQYTRLSEVAERNEARRRELFTQEQETRRRVEALLAEGGANQAQARLLIERMAELRVHEAELFRDEQEALLEVLTATQVLELQALRQDLGRRIRALTGGADGNRMPARPAGPPRGGRAGNDPDGRPR